MEVIDIAGDPALIAEHGPFVPVLTLEQGGHEQVWHKGPLSREQMPVLKMRLVRLTRNGGKVQATQQQNWGKGAMLRA